MRRSVLVAVAVPLLAVGFVDARPIAAATRERPSGSFLSVTFPCTTEDDSGIRETLLGDVHHSTLACHSGDAALSISASLLPPVITTLASDDMLYRRARRELLRNYDGEQTEWSSGRSAGFACRFLRYRAADGRFGRARLYLQDDTLVVIDAAYSEDVDVARTFLASAD